MPVEAAGGNGVRYLFYTFVRPSSKRYLTPFLRRARAAGRRRGSTQQVSLRVVSVRRDVPQRVLRRQDFLELIVGVSPGEGGAGVQLHRLGEDIPVRVISKAGGVAVRRRFRQLVNRVVAVGCGLHYRAVLAGRGFGAAGTIARAVSPIKALYV